MSGGLSNIAAVYCRKSNDQQVADEQKSVVRQLAHAREYAARKGWVVRDDLVFVDDGISGAEFANRPGFLRLMNSLKPRPSFQVLIMSEESRLGREQIEVSYALKQLIQSGVRVFCYLDDRERTLDSPVEKAMLALQTMADEMERQKASQRNWDSMARKARSGHHTGGRCFGYDNLTITTSDGTKSHVEQRINQSEAAVIRRIFELTASGMSRVGIAKQLNAEGTAAPRSQRGRPSGWAQSSVHEALLRPRYRGEIVWNRTKKRNRWGEKNPTNRPADEWVRVPAEHLRIVSDDLWRAAHARMALHQGPTNHRRSQRDSKYLLPGLARCAWCNGGLHVRSRPHDRRQVHFYACTAHFNRGESVCRNRVQMPMGDVDRAVIAAIREIMRPAVIEAIIAGVREQLEPNGRENLFGRLHADIAATEAQIANLTDAISIGGDIPALVERLKTANSRRLDLVRQREALEGGPLATRTDWKAVERSARSRLANWRGLLQRNVPEGRQVLRTLLTGPIMFTPIIETTKRGVDFAGALEIGELLAGNVEVTNLASPVGFGRLLPPIHFQDSVILSRLC